MMDAHTQNLAKQHFCPNKKTKKERPQRAAPYWTSL